MNETKKLYDSISNLDSRFIEEARAVEIKRVPTRRGWAALAACLCIAAVSTVAVIHPWGAGDTPVPTANVVPGGTLDEPDGGNEFAAMFNDIDAAPVGGSAMINLAAEDFRPMSVEKSLQYFGVSLPEDGTIPGLGLALTGGGCFGDEYGVYRTEERGIYYDVNSYLFTEGSKSVTLTLRTVFKDLTSWEQVKNGPEKINFTEIKGWHLALFRYEDEDGVECVYTEFARDGVVFAVTTRGLENNELALALASILPQKQGNSEPSAAVGTVTHVDSRTEDYFDGVQHHYKESHDYIGLDCGGTTLTVWLPGEADRFNVGDSVTVTYNGEPATAFNIWPGQLVGVE